MTVDLPEFPGCDVWAEVDLPTMPKITEEQVLRLFRSAVMAGGELIRRTWERRAVALRVRHTGAYLRGIKKDARIEIETEQETGESTYEVVLAVTNTANHASIVEDGHPAFHLPSKIDWSSANGSIRRTATGSPYLIIPFRHAAFIEPGARGAGDGGTGGPTTHALKTMLPREVYREALAMEHSHALKTGPVFEVRQAPRGGVHRRGQRIPAGVTYQQFVKKDSYSWAKDSSNRSTALKRPRGFHRPGQIVAGRKESWVETRGARGKNPAWGGSKFEGMRRMGEPKGTAYMTWRVITPDSQGWHIPALAGKHVAAQVAQVVPDVVGPFIEEAFHNLLEERGL